MRYAREIDQIALELEAETARLRKLEAALSTCADHYSASDLDMPPRVYGSIPKPRVWAVLAHQRDSRRRVENQLALSARSEMRRSARIKLFTRRSWRGPRTTTRRQQKLHAQREPKPALTKGQLLARGEVEQAWQQSGALRAGISGGDLAATC
jgi:hypothetical protein